jgi:hypothetical protein
VYVLLRPFALIVNKSWEGKSWEGWEGWPAHLARCSDAPSSLGPRALPMETQTAAEKSAKAGARSGLDALFVPDSVAVIGATERPGTVGRTVLSNLIESRFRSTLYAVNPGHSGASRT